MIKKIGITENERISNQEIVQKINEIISEVNELKISVKENNKEDILGLTLYLEEEFNKEDRESDD